MPDGNPWGEGYCADEAMLFDADAHKASIATQLAWAKLLAQAMPDAKGRVVRAMTTWNQRVREQLRNETGFRMACKNGPITVRLSVSDGLPIKLVEVLGGEALANGELLLHLNDFQQAAKGTALAAKQFVQIHALMALNENVKPAAAELASVSNLLTQVAARLTSLNLSERILQIDEDVLGAYYFRRPEANVFWTPIAILSASSGLSIEALTFVTLTHELAHAYTHLGLDISGEQWDTKAFAESSDEMVEGYAQHYTERVCRHFETQFPAALATFLSLRERQPDAYRKYTTWPSRDDGEAIRFRLRIESCRQTDGPTNSESVEPIDPFEQ